MSFALIFILSALGMLTVGSIFSIVSFFRNTGDFEKRGLQAAFIGTLFLIAAFLSNFFVTTNLYTPFNVLVFYSFAVTSFYVLVSIRHDTRSLSAFLLPYVTLLIFIAMFHRSVGNPIDPKINSIWLGLHVLSSLAGYALFTVASFFAAGYLIQDQNLKHKQFGKLFHKLPSLETFDKLIFSQISYGFLLFSVSILLGIVLLHLNNLQTRWTGDPKIITTGFTWALYALLFYLRFRADQHGKKVAIITFAGFFFIIATFFGVSMLTSSLHNIFTPDFSGGAQ